MNLLFFLLGFVAILGLTFVIAGSIVFLIVQANKSTISRHYLDHVAFQVSDLDRALTFYTEVLGLKLISKTIDEKHQEAFAFLRLYGGKLELLQPLNSPNRYKPQEVESPYCPHLAIRSDNLDKTVEHFQNKHVKIIKGPLEIPGKVRWCYIHDPDNNIIEYVEWL